MIKRLNTKVYRTQIKHKERIDGLKIGIIAAMEEELSLLVEEIDCCTKIHFGQFTYYTGQVGDTEVVLFLSGIGKVNAAVGATLLIDKLAPDFLINTGVAGGFPEELNIGDIVISSEVRYHDADATAFNYEFGQIPKMPTAYRASKYLMDMACSATLEDNSVRIHKGTILSGDSFVHQPDQIKQILGNFPEVMAVEMEGAAIAQTSYLFDVPFLLIRSVSDKVYEHESVGNYSACMAKVAENSVRMVLHLLENIQESA
jgi:adenosylhomocysteine nucleosidase